MTTTTNTSTTHLPKNKTGLFAADTLKDVKTTKHQTTAGTNLPSTQRNNGSTNLLLAISEKNHHQAQQTRLSKNETQQFYPIEENYGTIIDTKNDSRKTSKGIRNGFRPSTVRRQKLCVKAASSHRENDYRDRNDLESKFTPIPSTPATARLKCEIDGINSKLKLHGDVNKNLRLQPNRDATSTPQSALSYSTSCCLSSTSTNQITNPIFQRFSPLITEGLIQPTQSTTEQDKIETISHAFQIPQQSNVGNEGMFIQNSPIASPSRANTPRNIHPSYGRKSASCPFYVMYFTNLTMQRHHSQLYPNGNDRTNSSVVSSPSRKSSSRTHTNTSFSYNRTNQRQLHSPLSMNTCSTTEDLDSMVNATSYYHNKRFSAKMAAFENENTFLLKDVLRTTSWNHVQV